MCIFIVSLISGRIPSVKDEEGAVSTCLSLSLYLTVLSEADLVCILYVF